MILDEAVKAFEARFAGVGHVQSALERYDEINPPPPPVIRMQGARAGEEYPAGRDFSEVARGLPYIAVHNGCVLHSPNPECGDFVAHETEESAIASLFHILEVHAADAFRAGRTVLVWRIMPETDRYPGHKKGDVDPIILQPYPADRTPYWRGYARFAIIADPRMASAA